MLHREDEEGLIVIGQPAHAWVPAQLARAWVNDRFGCFEPWEEPRPAYRGLRVESPDAWDRSGSVQGFPAGSGRPEARINRRPARGSCRKTRRQERLLRAAATVRNAMKEGLARSDAPRGPR